MKANRRSARVLLAVLGLAAIGTSVAPTHAYTHRCPDLNAEVEAPGPDDAKAACTGAAAAARFLTDQGLDASERIEMRVVATLPVPAHPFAAGSYVHAERRVYLLSFSEFQKQEEIAQLSVSAGMYRSMIAHEAAHAITARNFTVARPSLRAHEYIACTTQFAAMPQDERERALGRFTGEGFDDETQMNTTIYLMNPAWFCVQAYRHFLRPENGRAFVQRVLAGLALREEE
ncbi:MAG TPA: DUF6639 family protein [Burkholderiaceae bacterium]|nr:DUF6639 family protein [Burkholderiaceae bacterium]